MHESAVVVLPWLFLYFLVIGIPAAQILHRTGFSRWFTLLLFIPLVNIVALWMFAFGTWRVDFKDEREHNRAADNWTEAEREAFRAMMNKPQS